MADLWSVADKVKLERDKFVAGVGHQSGYYNFVTKCLDRKTGKYVAAKTMHLSSYDQVRLPW